MILKDIFTLVELFRDPFLCHDKTVEKLQGDIIAQKQKIDHLKRELQTIQPVRPSSESSEGGIVGWSARFRDKMQGLTNLSSKDACQRDIAKQNDRLLALETESQKLTGPFFPADKRWTIQELNGAVSEAFRELASVIHSVMSQQESKSSTEVQGDVFGGIADLFMANNPVTNMKDTLLQLGTLNRRLELLIEERRRILPQSLTAARSWNRSDLEVEIRRTERDLKELSLELPTIRNDQSGEVMNLRPLADKLAHQRRFLLDFTDQLKTVRETREAASRREHTEDDQRFDAYKAKRNMDKRREAFDDLLHMKGRIEFQKAYNAMELDILNDDSLSGSEKKQLLKELKKLYRQQAEDAGFAFVDEDED